MDRGPILPVPLGIRPVLSKYRIEVKILQSWIVCSMTQIDQMNQPTRPTGSVLGFEGPEEGEPGPGGSAASRYRMCWERSSICPHFQLQEKPQLQHPCQVVWSGISSSILLSRPVSMHHCCRKCCFEVQVFLFACVRICPRTSCFTRRWTSEWWTAGLSDATLWWAPTPWPACGSSSSEGQTSRPTTGQQQARTDSTVAHFLGLFYARCEKRA